MATRLVVVGTSGHAGVAVDAIERCGGFEIAGLLDSFRSPGESAFGYPVIGPEDRLPAFLREHGECECVIAIGDNFQRRRIAARLREFVPALRLRTIVHPAACISPRAVLGDGVLVLAGAIVCAGARVGEGGLLNTASSLDHDCDMAPWSSLGPRATVGGNVRIGACSAIGMGACILEGRLIGDCAVVGGGAVVCKDLGDLVVATGVPARVQRSRREDEPYLRARGGGR